MNPALLIALRLSKAGFGSPVEILRMPVSIVLGAMDFDRAQSDYADVYRELNP